MQVVSLCAHSTIYAYLGACMLWHCLMRARGFWYRRNKWRVYNWYPLVQRSRHHTHIPTYTYVTCVFAPLLRNAYTHQTRTCGCARAICGICYCSPAVRYYHHVRRHSVHMHIDRSLWHICVTWTAAAASLVCVLLRASIPITILNSP